MEIVCLKRYWIIPDRCLACVLSLILLILAAQNDLVWYRETLHRPARRLSLPRPLKQRPVCRMPDMRPLCGSP